MMFVAKQALDDSIQSAKGKITGTSNPNNINWDDFNYPPLINVIHFSISDAEPDKRFICRALWLSHVLIFLESILNIINNIALVSVGYGKGVYIFYSFMFFFSFNPIATFVFYRGHKGVCSDAFLLQLYKWTQILLILLWLTFSIVSFLGFNGFICVSPLFKAGYVFQAIMAIIESSFFLLAALLSLFALVKVFMLTKEN